MSVSWDYYNDERFERVNDMFLPASGEGDTKATQLVTAINKLIYKYYNDGDVFDNTNGILEGWANDLSSYANWIRKYIPGSERVLDSVYDCFNGREYEDLLRDLADEFLDLEDLENLNNEPKVGSIYDCEGPYEFNEFEDDDEYDEDDYPYEDENDDEYDYGN